MHSSIALFAGVLAAVSALPSPQSTGTVGLGEQCSTSADCADGVNCYATNSGLIPQCGNFQASCTTDSQCAYNTCVDGLCNGFIATTTTASSAQSTATGTVALGAQCTSSADCVNGADCYAVNSMLITTCGNFQSSCTSDDQCAFNTCEDGFCNGFIAPTTTSTAAQSTSTSMVYLPLGANCNPKSTPCANGADCYAVNSMLQPRCGNYGSSCTSDSQCAYNVCNTDSGLCTGPLATTLTTSASSSTATASA